MALEYILEIISLLLGDFQTNYEWLESSVPSCDSIHDRAATWIGLLQTQFVSSLNMTSNLSKSAFTKIWVHAQSYDWQTHFQPIVMAFHWLFDNSASIGSFIGMILAILMGGYILITSIATVMLILLGADSKKEETDNPNSCDHTPAEHSTLSLFDLAKTAYEPGHTEALIKKLELSSYDINFALPSNGLSLFLCSCLSGQRRLIRYLLKYGADLKVCTKDGDSAFYLGTYGVLNSTDNDIAVLKDLLAAGCNVNQRNNRGYTALHRAASKGNKDVVKFLLENGADPYIKSRSGVYPIDSATNAGHLEAAELLEISVKDSNVWDDVDPHTPVKASLGLMSPKRKHLVESTFQGSRMRTRHDVFSCET
ncbi:unnamed protein product [Owenia fusiformis]|uniref:Uncharacterized protein n=1 Tax=Owenia fusiformis TaxID=6347 RepID=A0A8J1Y314_OWEFU|nr:unnamed protein product [Owenia fusiformis]